MGEATEKRVEPEEGIRAASSHHKSDDDSDDGSDDQNDTMAITKLPHGFAFFIVTITLYFLFL